jgi:K+-sensing histidine kinase KdpD
MTSTPRAAEHFNSKQRRLNSISESGLFSYSQKLDSTASLSSIIGLFKNALKKYHPSFSSEIFAASDKLNSFTPLDPGCDPEIQMFIKEKVDTTIIDWIAESKKIIFLPYPSDRFNKRLNCFIIPVYNNKSLAGFLATITPLSYLSEDSTEYKLLKLLFDITFSKVQQEMLRSELHNNYLELQTLQSKIANDYKLAAIGEFASKAVENIASPLQVILSCADLLPGKSGDLDPNLLETLKEQIHEIKEVIKRITYFISSPQTNSSIQSCNINDSIKEFIRLIEQSIKTESYECVLDLDEQIPPILSNHDNIKQILINSFSLINPFNNSGEGIIIQTRYSNGIVVLRFLFTNRIIKCEKSDVGLTILEKLMDKHEGFFDFTFDASRGTILNLSFPLKRKNRS